MHRPLKFSVWFSIVIAAVFVVAWLWIRESSEPGPYNLEPINIVRNGNEVGPTPSEVQGWQTYRNEKYGFEIKYPKDWKFEEVLLHEPATGFFLQKNDFRLAILPRGEFDYGLPFSEPQISDVSLDGKLAKKREYQSAGSDGKKYFVVIYNFVEPIPNWTTCGNDLKSCNRLDINVDGENLKVINQILSTFRFLE